MPSATAAKKLHTPTRDVSAATAQDKPRKRFFYRLNQLRMPAALLVFATHAEICKGLMGFGTPNISILLPLGHQAINFFFALSGFLITYLILAEQREAGKINVGNFYMRRILRVWPLYFLTVGLAFFALPHFLELDPVRAPLALQWQENLDHHFWLFFTGYALMVPNLVVACGQIVNGITHSWTVGVEEQFYLMWPLLILLFRKRILLMMVSIMVLKTGLLLSLKSPGLHSIATQAPALNLAMGALHNFVSFFYIESLALGSIAACFLIQKPQSTIVRAAEHPFLRYVALLPLLLAPFLPAGKMIIEYGPRDFVFSCVFAFFLISLAKADEPPQTNLGRFINYCGTITYGFYMYHMLVLILVLSWLQSVPELADEPSMVNAIVYGLSFVVSLAISVASYQFFELPFLKLKNRFSFFRD